MKIQRAARSSDDFLDDLKTKMAQAGVPLIDKRLEKEREEPKEDTTEKLLEKNRKDEKEPPHIEERLEKKTKELSENQKIEGIVERRLEEASDKNYPHRNEEAWERTEEKRPVNSLPEEMAGSSDDEKNERYEKAEKTNPEKRSVDKDIGKQRKNEKIAFNLFLQYKGDAVDAKRRFSKVCNVDAELSKIMALAGSEKRNLTEEEKKQISAMKAQKSKLLGIG
jgi:hypothetical protein